MPHKIYGRATADQAMQSQKVSTALIRQTLDNLYKSNNPRPVVEENAIADSTMDDIGETAPGASITVRNIAGFRYDAVPFTAGHSMQMLEAVAVQAEERTGFQRKGNGLNPETLKKNSPDTATQASIDENSRNERAEMIARIFAETGVKRLFKLLLGLLIKNQPRERVIRLRNTWVEMDPRGWNPEMDVTISVGLGVGNKSELIGQAQSVLQAQERLGATPYGYLLEPQHVHKAMTRLYTASGIKNPDDYIGDPAQLQAPEPQPDPKMAEAQAKMQMEQQKAQGQMQVEQAKMQAKAQTDAQNIQLETAKAQAQIQIAQAQAQAKAQTEAARLQLEQAKADFEARLAMQESQFQAQLEMEKLRMQRENAAFKATTDAMSKERPGGALDD